MFWIACHFPQLPLEVFLRGLPSSVSTRKAWAVIDEGAVLACSAHARAQGIRCGISLSAAYALAPQLEARKRDPALEAATLARIAAWCGQFTPNVALDSTAFCLLDVSGSLKLFGGITPITDALRKGLSDLGFSAILSAAPTPRGAQLLARAGRSTVVEDLRSLAAELGRLSVRALDCAPATAATLCAFGANTLADCLRLPRAGLARRCGQQLLDDLDRALGRLPDPKKFFVPPEHFAAKLELPAEVEHAEALLFAARRLLVELTGFLAARASGVQRVRLKLLHREPPDTDITIGLVAASRDAEHFTLLVRERLAGITLRQPVQAIALYAGTIVPLAGRNHSLFSDTRETGDRTKLIERLYARLGQNAVHGIAVHPDHRPERAWRRCKPGEAFTAGARTFPAPRLTMNMASNFPRTVTLREGLLASRAPGTVTAFTSGAVTAPAPGIVPAPGLRLPCHDAPRPIWLLPQPRPLAERNGVPQRGGPLALLSGPERLEAGWWDGADIARDYFIARAPGESLLWIYRERSTARGWYLHGIFG